MRCAAPICWKALRGEAQPLAHHLLDTRAEFRGQVDRADADRTYLVQLVHDLDEAATADLGIGLAQPAQLALLPVCLLGQDGIHARATLGRHAFADQSYGGLLGSVQDFGRHALDDADAGHDNALSTHLLGQATSTAARP